MLKSSDLTVYERIRQDHEELRELLGKIQRMLTKRSLEAYDDDIASSD